MVLPIGEHRPAGKRGGYFDADGADRHIHAKPGPKVCHITTQQRFS